MYISIAFYSPFTNISLAQCEQYGPNSQSASQPVSQHTCRLYNREISMCLCVGGITELYKAKNTESGETTEQQKYKKKNDTHRVLRQEICNMNRVRCRFSFYLIFLVLALFHLNSPILSPLSPLSLCIQHWRFTFSRTVPFVPGLLGIFSCVEYRKFSYFLLVVAPPTFMCFA